MQNVEFPMFGRANNTMNSQSADNWGEVDTLDVDLLTEYLLNDNNLMNNSGVTFDMSFDNNGGLNSTLVSPENSEDGKLPTVADQNQNQMLYQAASISNNNNNNVNGNNVAYAMNNVVAPAMQMNQQNMNNGNNNLSIAPAPNMQNFAAALNPSMLTPQQLQMLQQQMAPIMNMQMQQQQQPQQQQILPHPGNLLNIAPQGAMMFQNFQVQQNDDSSKRRRVEVPVLPSNNNNNNVAAPNNIAAAAAMINTQQLAAAAAEAMSQQGRGRKKSQAQIDRRRERNRILARKTRLRKKFFFESLQKEIMDLQRENVMLKTVVKENIDEENGKEILDGCDALEKLPEAVIEACGELAGDLDAQDFNLVKSIQSSQHSFIITDPSLTDNPIVFASDDFCKLTGYKREEVLGRNCRFLQGTETSSEKVEQIRKGIAAGEDVSVTLVNYMADGTAFWNKLFIAALRDAQNNIVNYIGVIVRVASPEPGEAEHGKILSSDKNNNNSGDDYSDDDGSQEDY